MTNITQLAQTLQDLLTTVADRLGHESGFIRRKRKFSGATFAQTVVFTWMADSDAPESKFPTTAAAVDLQVSRQGIVKRFTAKAAEFLKQLLHAATDMLVSADPVAIPLLKRFTAVNVLDSSIVTLPAELADVYLGGRSGTTTQETAAVKVTAGLDLKTGTLQGPVLCDGRKGDLKVPLAQEDPPPKSLNMADLGYFSLKKFGHWNECGAYWLSRLKSGTTVYDVEGNRVDLLRLLRAAGDGDVDLDVVLGVQEQVGCRLIARRVPAAVAEKRRQHLLHKSKRRGDRPSALSLQLAEWTILLTNVPRELLNVTEAVTLYRLRWQIELIFKLWKGEGGLTAWRSAKPQRVLCEIYAKLLATIIKHWVMISGAWSKSNRSPTKAVRVVSDMALSLVNALRSVRELRKVLKRAGNIIRSTCTMDHRSKSPNAYDLLLGLGPGS